MGTVTLRFRASAAHVRTARLVAVSVARRAGFDEIEIEGVRQAVGEVCGLLVRRLEPADELILTLDDEPADPASARLVVCAGPAEPAPSPQPGDAHARMALALLNGLADGLVVHTGATELRLTWTA